MDFSGRKRDELELSLYRIYIHYKSKTTPASEVIKPPAEVEVEKMFYDLLRRGLQSGGQFAAAIKRANSLLAALPFALIAYEEIREGVEGRKEAPEAIRDAALRTFDQGMKDTLKYSIAAAAGPYALPAVFLTDIALERKDRLALLQSGLEKKLKKLKKLKARKKVKIKKIEE